MLKRYFLYVQLLLIMRNCITAELVKEGISSSEFLLNKTVHKNCSGKENLQI
jgi:hypothetical protein